MQQIYFKFDTNKRMEEIMNATNVLDARRNELCYRLSNGNLSIEENIRITEELIKGMKELQAYREEMEEIGKIILLRIKMMGEGL